MYNLATDEPYSFWYINWMAKDINKMFFYIRFEQTHEDELTFIRFATIAPLTHWTDII